MVIKGTTLFADVCDQLKKLIKKREHRLPVSLCRTHKVSVLAGAESVHETAEKNLGNTPRLATGSSLVEPTAQPQP